MTDYNLVAGRKKSDIYNYNKRKPEADKPREPLSLCEAFGTPGRRVVSPISILPISIDNNTPPIIHLDAAEHGVQDSLYGVASPQESIIQGLPDSPERTNYKECIGAQGSADRKQGSMKFKRPIKFRRLGA